MDGVCTTRVSLSAPAHSSCPLASTGSRPPRSRGSDIFGEKMSEPRARIVRPRPYRLTRLGAGHNAPLAAVPMLGQRVFGEVAALEPPDSPDVTGRDDSDPNEKIVDRARLVGACGAAPLLAVPVCDQDLSRSPYNLANTHGAPSRDSSDALK